jgi:hypothetical protein
MSVVILGGSKLRDIYPSDMEVVVILTWNEILKNRYGSSKFVYKEG